MFRPACFPCRCWPKPCCPPTPAYSPCDVVFEMSGGGDAGASESLPERHFGCRIPFAALPHLPAAGILGWRQPSRGCASLQLRPGGWDFRVTSNLARFDGKTGPGRGHRRRIRPASSGLATFTIGDTPRTTSRTCGWATRASQFPLLSTRTYFDKLVASARAAEVQPHPRPGDRRRRRIPPKPTPSPDRPEAAHFRRLDRTNPGDEQGGHRRRPGAGGRPGPSCQAVPGPARSASATSATWWGGTRRCTSPGRASTSSKTYENGRELAEGDRHAAEEAGSIRPSALARARSSQPRRSPMTAG